MNMTAGTVEYTNIQRHRLPVSAPAACLTGIGRVDCNVLPTSFFRFAGQFLEEFRPRGVMNALGKTVVMRHAVDRQVLYCDDPKAIDNAPAFLMREIVAAEGDALVHPRYCFAMLTPLRSTFRQLAMLALHFRQGFLLFAEKAGVSNLAPVREGGKGFQPYINPDLFCSLRQTLELYLTRKRGIPFSGTASVDGERFDLAAQWAMQDDLDMSNARGVELAFGVDLEARLWIREAIIAPFAPETRIARFFTCLAPSEKRLKGQINADGYVLQDLRVDSVESGASLFEYRIGGLLLIARQLFAFLLKCDLATFKQVVVEPTALFQRLVELGFLLFGWVYPVLKHLTHVSSIHLNPTGVDRQGTPAPLSHRRNAAFIPMFSNRGFQRRKVGKESSILCKNVSSFQEARRMFWNAKHDGRASHV
jgi:hypothetical protein